MKEFKEGGRKRGKAGIGGAREEDSNSEFTVRVAPLGLSLFPSYTTFPFPHAAEVIWGWNSSDSGRSEHQFSLLFGSVDELHPLLLCPWRTILAKGYWGFDRVERSAGGVQDLEEQLLILGGPHEQLGPQSPQEGAAGAGSQAVEP